MKFILQAFNINSMMSTIVQCELTLLDTAIRAWSSP